MGLFWALFRDCSTSPLTVICHLCRIFLVFFQSWILRIAARGGAGDFPRCPCSYLDLQFLKNYNFESESGPSIAGRGSRRARFWRFLRPRCRPRSRRNIVIRTFLKKTAIFAILGIAIRVAARKGPKRRFFQQPVAEMGSCLVPLLLPCFAQETRMFELCFCYQSCIRAAHLEGEYGAGVVAFYARVLTVICTKKAYDRAHCLL